MRLLTITLLVIGALLLAGGDVVAVGLEVERIEDAAALQCPVCSRLIRAGHIHMDAETTMVSLMQDGLIKRDVKYTLGPEERTLNVLIFRFQERRGGNFAADKPASVGYHIHLLEGETPVRVFVFDETQEPLLSNLLNFFTAMRRGFRWVTAAELANEGVEKALDLFIEDIR